MKSDFHATKARGFSLLETVIAISVLAIAVPLALVAVTRAGVTGAAARAETRAPAIAEWCRLEMEAARSGRSAVLPKLPADADFPAGGAVLALAFDGEGALIGAVAAEDFRKGVERVGDARPMYLAALSGRTGPGGVVVTVRVEYPAARPEDRRDGVSFHTILP
jgi:prepilin-type N-terminal cleavage/methylation domain-containing protein